jgi:hypothetical protein
MVLFHLNTFIRLSFYKLLRVGLIVMICNFELITNADIIDVDVSFLT